METVILDELIRDLSKYKAHTKEEAEGESLKEHTDRTYKYFTEFWQKKDCDEVFKRFCDTMWHDLDNEVKEKTENILKKMIFNIPIFHDAGKINPLFQEEVMKNTNFAGNKDFGNKNHAMISAIIYIDYFRYTILSKAGRKVKELLKPFVLYHAYVISRHHVDLHDFNLFINKLNSEETLKNVQAVNKNRLCYRDVKWLTVDIENMADACEKLGEKLSKEQSLYLYIYEKWLYSLLVASDYYATGEFENGAEFKQDGDIDDICVWKSIYENTPLMQGIRNYQRKIFPQSEQDLRQVKDINVLRTEIFCEAEANLKSGYKNSIFYLEAPTGSGKSNTAINLSFKLMETDRRLKKIFYVYPFNTLVEQNMETLENIFGENKTVMQNIAVLNSLTPIKIDMQNKGNEDTVYQKTLFDRQFLNYPMVLTTHVNLFDVLFGSRQKSVFGFYQLINSVIVLDEIQSYKNTIWPQIISYLKAVSEFFNMKIIIMSATLPNLDKVSFEQNTATTLLKDTQKYFSNEVFKNRVEISYDILKRTDLKGEQLEEYLKEHIKRRIKRNKHIIIEFIKKSTAHRFWEKLKNDEEITCEVEYLSGDDSMAERKRILDRIKTSKDALILVATQVIEAGVDIDMDLGYKDISKLDSEEQFLGRINRSCRKSGRVYFFDLDKAKSVYKEDVRNNTDLTLIDEKIRTVLKKKNFGIYYNKVLAILEKNYKSNYDAFFRNVKELKWEDIEKQMKLIDDDEWNMTVYLAKTIEDGQGKIIDGVKIWEKYKKLLRDYSMSYAENRVKLSCVTAQMAEFMYQIKKVALNSYDEKIGDVFYIKDGEKYFDEGKLNRARLQGEASDFVDFI